MHIISPPPIFHFKAVIITNTIIAYSHPLFNAYFSVASNTADLYSQKSQSSPGHVELYSRATQFKWRGTCRVIQILLSF